MAVRTYITETEFAKIDNPQSSTTYIVLDDNDPTLVKKVVFKTNNINNEGELYIVQDEYPTPSGAISITANGENIDVKQYATANVNVPNPSTGTLNITNNATYDVKNYEFAEVDVPNPSTGTLNITSNDTYDVTNYASAQVNVPQPSGKITITSNGTDIDIAQYASADVNVPTGEKTTCKFKFAGNGNFTFNKLGDGKYYLKKNDGEWTEYTTSQTVSVVNGDIIELKSDLTPLPDNNWNDLILSFTDHEGYGRGVPWELEGDLLGTLFGNVLCKGGCKSMFSLCSGLTKVPSNMFANYNYIPDSFCSSMFFGCYSLITAPTLSATILGDSAYSSMFRGCRGLTTAPALPATTLSSSCYEEMFKECTGLTTAPVLPATTLATYCYQSMFSGCTSLTTAPELPATTLAQYCYSGMFSGCTSLTTAPELPATTVARYCYEYMFSGCTSLTTAPELNATTSETYCYERMFNGCSSLNYIKCLLTSPSNTNAWVQNVAATGTFVKNPNATWTTGNSGIPSGWTVQDAA